MPCLFLSYTTNSDPAAQSVFPASFVFNLLAVKWYSISNTWCSIQQCDRFLKPQVMLISHKNRCRPKSICSTNWFFILTMSFEYYMMSLTSKTGMLHQNCRISIYSFHHYQERASWRLWLSLAAFVSVVRLFGFCGSAKFLSKFVSDKVQGPVEFSRHCTQWPAYAIGPFIIPLSRVAHLWSNLHFIVWFF